MKENSQLPINARLIDDSQHETADYDSDMMPALTILQPPRTAISNDLTGAIFTLAHAQSIVKRQFSVNLCEIPRWVDNDRIVDA